MLPPPPVLGSSACEAIYFGSTEVCRAYLGDNIVYDKAASNEQFLTVDGLPFITIDGHGFKTRDIGNEYLSAHTGTRIDAAVGKLLGE